MPARKHDFTTTEILAGLMVLAGAAVFVLFIAAVQGLRPPKPMNTFRIVFKWTRSHAVGLLLAL